MYLTYDEYQSLGGTLDETTFSDFEFDAEQIINWHTFNRLANDTYYDYSVKRLTYKLIEINYMKQQAKTLGKMDGGVEQTGNSAISSQSNDGFSTTYNVLNASESLRVFEEDTERLINQYLQYATNSMGHRLLYRGLYPNE